MMCAILKTRVLMKFLQFTRHACNGIFW